MALTNCGVTMATGTCQYATCQALGEKKSEVCGTKIRTSVCLQGLCQVIHLQFVFYFAISWPHIEGLDFFMSKHRYADAAVNLICWAGAQICLTCNMCVNTPSAKGVFVKWQSEITSYESNAVFLSPHNTQTGCLPLCQVCLTGHNELLIN